MGEGGDGAGATQDRGEDALDVGRQMLAGYVARRPRLASVAAEVEVAEATLEGPVQLSLTTTFERRGLRYRTSPAKARVLAPPPPPDPWATELVHDGSAGLGSEVSLALEDEVPLHCAVCSAVGRHECPRCGGSGRISVRASDGSRSERCDTCTGEGQVACKECRGTGTVIGRATVWSRLEAHCEVRSLEAEDLPLDVAADLATTKAGGALLHEEEAAHLDGIHLRRGYREAGPHAAALEELATRLCAHPGLDEGVRVVRQRLEVRRPTAARLVLRDRSSAGRRFTMWLWGDPPRCWPLALEQIARRRMWGRVVVAGLVVVVVAAAFARLA